MLVEQNCQFKFREKTFEAGGALVTDERLIAYPATELTLTTGDLNDWHGNKIGTCRVLSSWPIRSYISDRMFSYEAFVDGIRYVGRGCGKGMLLRAKRSPRQRQSL